MKLIKESLECIGYKSTRDLEINDKNHNFLIEGNIVTSNSHSLAYSINAYMSMYLKIYYPLEYFANLFNYSDLDEMKWFFKMAKEVNIKFNNFLCNETEESFSVDYDNNSIKMGLNMVKGLNKNDIKKLLNNKINNFNELILFVKDQKLNKKSIELLCRLQYFKNLFSNSKGLEQFLLRYRNIKKKEESLIPSLIEESKIINDYTLEEQLQFEKEYLGFYLQEHPFVLFDFLIKKELQNANIKMLSPKDCLELSSGKYILYGILNKVEIRKTKSNKNYSVLILEDDRTQVNIKIWDEDIFNLQKGSKCIINVDKNDYGFSKIKSKAIIKYDYK